MPRKVHYAQIGTFINETPPRNKEMPPNINHNIMPLIAFTMVTSKKQLFIITEKASGSSVPF